jgi:anaphase-promoting complex subunit 1
LYTLLAVPHGRNSFPRLAELARTFDLCPALEYGKRDPTERVHLWNDVFNVLCDPAVGDQRARAISAVAVLINGDNKPSRIVRAIARLPLGIGAPIREALRSCQLNPPAEMSADGYALIERRDLAHMRSGRASGFTFGGEYEHRARMVSFFFRFVVGVGVYVVIRS